MNLTKNEILNLSLEDKQKLVVELGGISPGDRAYPNAKAIIELISADKKYKAPAKVKVKALDNVSVDGRDVKADQETEVYPWQYNALSRFFEKLEGAVKTAAAMAVLFLMLALPAQAQSQFTTTWLLPTITNAIPALQTNNYNTATLTTNTINMPVVTVSNGIPYFTTNTVSTVTTNIPGRVNLTHFDSCSIQWTYNLTAAGTSNNVATLYWNNDGTTNNVKAFDITATSTGTTPVTVVTNIGPFSAGYLFLGTMANLNASGAMTNIQFGISVKPIRSGP